MEPLISVIIPVFNINEFLPVCLDKICNQTYVNLEIIIIDDGSADGTARTCDIYAQRDSRITVIHKENEGQAVARNLAIQKSSGEYIAFVDGDDWIRQDYIECLYKLSIKYNAEIINCNFVKTKRFGYIDDNLGSMKEVLFDSEKAIENLCYLKELNCAPYSKLFRRHIWNDLKFPEGYLYEDLATIYRTYNAADKIIYVDYNGYFYFQRQGSSLNTGFSARKLSRVYFSKKIFNFVKSNYPHIVDAAYCRLFWSVSGALMDIPKNYENSAVKNEIIMLIKKTRLFVLRDKKCKKSVRILAFLSYFGVHIYKKILNLYKFFKQWGRIKE